MIKLTACHAYNQPIDEVVRYFGEEDLLKAKYERLGGKKVRIDVLEETDDGFKTETRREVDSNVPAFLASILGTTNHLTQVEQWHWLEDDSLSCELKVELTGVPISIQGTLHFVETAAGCDNHVAIQVSASLPLLGKKLEQFVAADIEKSIEAEYQVIAKALEQPDYLTL